MNQFLFKPGRLMIRPGRLMILLALLPGILASAQNLTDKSSVSRTYPVSHETTLEVHNKYGKIQVATWDLDSVAIEVDILLTESSKSKMRKLKEDIRIDFTGAQSYIIAKTMIKSESGRLASELKSIGNTISGSNKRVEINYLVHLPAYMDVVLTNKFGDIYMDDLEGQADIELSNGVLKANRLTGNSSISLSFANGMIKTLGSANLKLSYSDLVLDEASQLDLISKSSKLNVDLVNVLKIDSRRDKLYFKQVEFIYGKSNFTQVWVYDFLRESDLYMKYGELTIEHVMTGFSKIYVESDYTDITLYFDKDASLAFDIFRHEKSVLRLPGSESLSEDAPSGKDHFKTVGTMGEGDPVGQVNIDALQKCFIKISYK
jgi:hypothetical protein